MSLRDLAAREHGAAVTAVDAAAGLLVQGALAVAQAKGLPPVVAKVIAERTLAAVHEATDKALAERIDAPGVDVVGVPVVRE